MPCGFVLAGPSIAAHSTLFEQLERRVSEERTNAFILVSSTDAPNLKGLLKTVIKIGTSSKSLDNEELAKSKCSGRKLLDYDLQLLYDWVKDNEVNQVVLAFRDCEAFDTAVLSEAIELFKSVDTSHNDNDGQLTTVKDYGPTAYHLRYFSESLLP